MSNVTQTFDLSAYGEDITVDNIFIKNPIGTITANGPGGEDNGRYMYGRGSLSFDMTITDNMLTITSSLAGIIYKGSDGWSNRTTICYPCEIYLII